MLNCVGNYRTIKTIAFLPLAIEHMSAYMCGITDLTLGVSG